jgi:predicted CXXCH cytochrome family protein
LCLTCHSDLKAKIYPRAKAAAEKKEFADQSPAAVKAAEHPKIYVHAPTDIKHCNLCHKPHFAAESDLIVKPIQRLCGGCHDYQQPSFKAAHINIEAKKIDCRKCHDSHTSTNPKFFKAEIHKPFADKACKDCHIIE